MRFLGLDVGTKRTGMAFADSDDGILFSLETVQHSSQEDLVEQVQSVIAQKQIDEVVLGFPLLLSGKEGSQAKIVLEFQKKLENVGICSSLLDERYTTPKSSEFDKDAASACEIVSIRLQRN
jgi:putative Holliday junction resolvase